MAAEGVNMMAYVKDLQTNKNYKCSASEIFEIDEKNLICKRFCPVSAQDYDKDRIYGIQVGKEWMHYVYIVFMAETGDEIDEHTKKERPRAPRRLSGESLREKFSEFSLANAKAAAKTTKQKEQETKKRSKQHGADEVMADYLKKGKSTKRGATDIAKQEEKENDIPDPKKLKVNEEINQGSRASNLTDNVLTDGNFYAVALRKPECKEHCACKIYFEQQLILLQQDLQTTKNERGALKIQNAVLVKANQDLTHDREKMYDKIETMSTDISALKESLSSGKKSTFVQCQKIEDMTSSVRGFKDVTIPDEIPEGKIHCGPDLFVSKDDLYKVAEEIGLQKKVTAIITLFWKDKAHEYTLNPKKGQRKIEDIHKFSIKNLINGLVWKDSNQFLVDESQVADKIRRVTYQFRQPKTKDRMEDDKTPKKVDVSTAKTRKQKDKGRTKVDEPRGSHDGKIDPTISTKSKEPDVVDSDNSENESAEKDREVEEPANKATSDSDDEN